MPYTNQEYQELGLTPDEIAEMSNYGADINLAQDVHGIEALAQLYLNAGLDSEAERILGLKDDVISYMQGAIYEGTGWALEYNDEIGQWYKMAGQGGTSGQLVGYLGFDRNLSDDEYYQAMIDKLGTSPISP